MAIDDNTSYELTGYQVKDLAGRIRRKADASAIPTVNNATLTLVQNGTTVGTFTANQSTDTTVNLASSAMHLVAIGRNSAVSGIPTSTFVGVGCSKASGQSVIIDSTYASFASGSEDIILEPGQYFITASIRFGDVSSQNNNVFCGIKVQDSGVAYSDDDIRIGGWSYTNLRVTGEVSRYFDFDSGAKIRFQFWSQQTTTMSSALMHIFRIGD